MHRMKHDTHGFQMAQPADRLMFERAGWVIVTVEDAAPVIEPEPVEQAAEPKRRGRKPKVTA